MRNIENAFDDFVESLIEHQDAVQRHKQVMESANANDSMYGYTGWDEVNKTKKRAMAALAEFVHRLAVPCSP